MYIHNDTCHSTLVEKAKYLCQTVTQCRLVLVLCAGAAAAGCAQWTVEPCWTTGGAHGSYRGCGVKDDVMT